MPNNGTGFRTETGKKNEPPEKLLKKNDQLQGDEWCGQSAGDLQNPPVFRGVKLLPHIYSNYT